MKKPTKKTTKVKIKKPLSLLVELAEKVVVLEEDIKRSFALINELGRTLKRNSASIENFERTIIPKVVSMSEIYQTERHRLIIAFEHFISDLQ